MSDYEHRGLKIHRGEPIDPTSVEIGMVVEVEANDGTWRVMGEEIDGFDPDRRRLHIDVAGLIRHVSVTDATVRLVSRPEPAGDQVVAINTILRGIERDAGGDLSDLAAPAIARQLYARGVRVVEDGEQS